jgi:hypothetical protein
MKTNLADSYVSWLIKESAPVTVDELRYALKKHEDRETPAQEAEESDKEQDIERRAGIHEKTAFWRGFEKKAATARARAPRSDLGGSPQPVNPAESRAKEVIVPAGAAIAGNVLTTLGTAGILKVSPRVSDAEARDFAHKVNRLRNMNVHLRTHDGMPDLASVYSVEGLNRASNVRGTVHVPAKPNLGILAHELGHADSLGRKLMRDHPDQASAMAHGLPRVRGHQYRLLATPLLAGVATAATSNNSELESAVPYVTVLPALPTLLEEGKATYNGLKDIKRLKGTKDMLKSAPGLAAAFSTYASIPVGAALAAKYMINRRKRLRDLEKEAASAKDYA